jgi:hypothetical protein
MCVTRFKGTDVELEGATAYVARGEARPAYRRGFDARG